MFKLILPADRAEPDMAAVASAFGLSIQDVEDRIQIGSITRWFEVGEGDEDDKPHQIFDSVELGIRINVDERGAVRATRKHEDLRSHLQPNRLQSGNPSQHGHRTEATTVSGPQPDPEAARNARLDVLLDEALDESFPASDPVAISVGTPRRAARSSDNSDDD